MTINGISGGTGIEQTQASAARNRFRTVNDAASNYLGLSADELRGQLANGQSLAQVAEASGKSVDGLTQAIADAITKTDGSANATSIAERIISASPGAPPSGGFPPSGGGFGAQLAQVTRGGENSGASGLDAIRTAVNDFLGLTDDEVRSQLAQGQTLGEIAEANGKSVDGLTQAIADAITKTDGSANATSIAERIISASPGAPPSGGFPPSGGGFGAQLAQVTRGVGGNSGASGRDAIRTAVNDFLGLTDDEVRSQLAQGQTLGEIAEANGKTADDLEQVIAKAVANENSSADAAGIAHAIVSTQPRSGMSLEDGIGGTDFVQRLQGYGASGADGYSAGLAAPAGGLGGSTLEQLLLEKLATASGGAFRGIDDFA